MIRLQKTAGFFMEKFIRLEIAVDSQEESDIHMASLSEMDFYAFEQPEKFLIAYIKEGDFNEKKYKEILKNGVVYNLTTVENKNWNEEWERDFQPVYIHNFAGIRASFHKPLQNIKHEIIVTPKMSFGTGHHATTYLMIKQMEQINFCNKSVLDFGTGTGVLAILAEKLGAAKIVAVDNDEWSINNAIENIAINCCNKTKVQYNCDLSGLNVQDIILANINLNVLLESATKISSMVTSGSLLLLSGFFVQDTNALLSAYGSLGFIKNTENQLYEWSSLLLCRQ